MIRTEVNAYSARWFECFHVDILGARTALEVNFISACAPLPSFRQVLDLCCGMGRHARDLSSRGYSVTGIERDHTAIAKARELAGGPSYIRADIRDYQPDPGARDLVIVMAQSFGYFDATMNCDLLRRMAGGLRGGGRIILDLWNPEFFATHEGQRDFELSVGIVRETKHLDHDRLLVHLDYPNGGADNFEWQLFTTPEMCAMADLADLDLVVSCTNFDLSVGPSPAQPRRQFLLERR